MGKNNNTIGGQSSKGTNPIKKVSTEYMPKLDLEKLKKELSKQIKCLTYEDTLAELDLILSDLQADNVLVEDLQSLHLKGSICLEHCEFLLKQIESEVVELDLAKTCNESEGEI